MPSISEYGNGSKVEFSTPASGIKTVTVNGANATITAQDSDSVTLAVAPAAGSLVEISYSAVLSRMRTEEGSAAFQRGREYRVLFEVIKAANDVWTIRFTNTVPILLIAVNLCVDNGSIRYSTLSAPVFNGSFTPKTPLNQNRMAAVQPAPTTVVELGTGPAVQATGSAENDIMRVRAGGGNRTSSATTNASLHRGLAPGPHAIILGPITGVADTNAVNGTIELIWSELPDEL